MPASPRLFWALLAALATYYLGYNHVSLELALLLLVLPILWVRRRAFRWEPLTVLGAIYVIWNLVIAAVRGPHYFTEQIAIEYTLGALLLLPTLFLATWLLAADAEAMQRMAFYLGCVVSVAAVASLIYWHMALAPQILRNPLVHEGLHPVSTALLFSLSIVWLGSHWASYPARWQRWTSLGLLVVVFSAVVLTSSRGGLIFNTVGLLAAFCFRHWKKSLPPVLLLLVVFITMHQLPSTPEPKYLARKTSGRTHIYELAVQDVDRWDHHLLGRGMWNAERQVAREYAAKGFSFEPTHLHSMALSTYIHTGAIGCLMVLGLVLMGLKKTLQAARMGQPQWLMLYLAGCVVLLPDGSSLGGLLTHTRWDALLFWFPVAAACGACHAAKSSPR